MTKALACTRFEDPAPSLTKEAVELCKGVDFGDMMLKLPRDTSGQKAYETGLHHLLEVHDHGCKDKGGGFGGPLSLDPSGQKVAGLSGVLLQEAQNDRTLPCTNFEDPVPTLTKEQVALCRGVDFGEKMLEPPSGALPCSEPDCPVIADPGEGMLQWTQSMSRNRRLAMHREHVATCEETAKTCQDLGIDGSGAEEVLNLCLPDLRSLLMEAEG